MSKQEKVLIDSGKILMRDARLEDLDRLVELEQNCFNNDRLNRRSFRYLLTRGNAICNVVFLEETLAGYSLVLFRKNTSLARLYSIAVSPGFPGHGLAKILLAAAEEKARERNSVFLRLEVRCDNHGAIKLYRESGYREFGVYQDYYHDHMTALRYQKRLISPDGPGVQKVPYYRQSMEFTCGSAALMMAMRMLEPTLSMNRKLEIQIWREANTVFMTSGHGGCSPKGLALAAFKRGFNVRLYLSKEGPFFMDGVRNEQKKEVIQLVHDIFQEDLRVAGVPVYYRPLSLQELEEVIEDRGMVVVLISSYRIYGEKTPHWVVVTGIDDNFVYAHDPFVDEEEGQTESDSIHLPITREEFEKMARFGKNQLKAALVLFKGKSNHA